MFFEEQSNQSHIADWFKKKRAVEEKGQNRAAEPRNTSKGRTLGTAVSAHSDYAASRQYAARWLSVVVFATARVLKCVVLSLVFA